MMKKKVKIFDIVLIVIFTVFSLAMIIPVYKVLVDSFDLKTAYGMKLFPERFGLAGYKSIFTNPTMLRPFLISCYTTVMGTVMGLLISVLGAYVLIQWKMPGRAFVANVLLFTMIFNGGMIPTYLVMKEFHLTNNLWGVILLPAINVYNLVLMKNFFEGIPVSLMESAEIDGCSHFRILYKIVLPLSKAALASIGLMYAVGYWNDYTTGPPVDRRDKSGYRHTGQPGAADVGCRAGGESGHPARTAGTGVSQRNCPAVRSGKIRPAAG